MDGVMISVPTVFYRFKRQARADGGLPGGPVAHGSYFSDFVHIPDTFVRLSLQKLLHRHDHASPANTFTDEAYQKLLVHLNEHTATLGWLRDFLLAEVGVAFPGQTLTRPAKMLLKEISARTSSYLIAAAAPEEVLQVIATLTEEGGCLPQEHADTLRKGAPMLSEVLESYGYFPHVSGALSGMRGFPPRARPLIASLVQKARSFWATAARMNPESLPECSPKGPAESFEEGCLAAPSAQWERLLPQFRQNVGARPPQRRSRQAAPGPYVSASQAGASAAAAVSDDKMGDNYDAFDFSCHAPTDHSHSLSPGLACVMCAHGVIYGMWFMDSFESPRSFFDFIVKRFPVAPEIIIYGA